METPNQSDLVLIYTACQIQNFLWLEFENLFQRQELKTV